MISVLVNVLKKKKFKVNSESHHQWDVKFPHTCQEEEHHPEVKAADLLSFDASENTKAYDWLEYRPKEKVCKCTEAYWESINRKVLDSKAVQFLCNDEWEGSNALEELYVANAKKKGSGQLFTWCAPSQQLLPVALLVDFAYRDSGSQVLVQYQGQDERYQNDVFVTEKKQLLWFPYSKEQFEAAAYNTVCVTWPTFKQLLDTFKESLVTDKNEPSDENEPFVDSSSLEKFVRSYNELQVSQVTRLLNVIAEQVKSKLDEWVESKEKSLSVFQRQESLNKLCGELLALLGMYSVFVTELHLDPGQCQKLHPTSARRSSRRSRRRVHPTSEQAGSVKVLLLHNVVDLRFVVTSPRPPGKCCVCQEKAWFSLHSLVCDFCGKGDKVKARRRRRSFVVSCASCREEQDFSDCDSSECSDREERELLECDPDCHSNEGSDREDSSACRDDNENSQCCSHCRWKPLEKTYLCGTHVNTHCRQSGCAYKTRRCVVCKVKEVRYTFSGEEPTTCSIECFQQHFVQLPKLWRRLMQSLTLKTEPLAPEESDDSSEEESSSYKGSSGDDDDSGSSEGEADEKVAVKAAPVRKKHRKVVVEEAVREEDRKAVALVAEKLGREFVLQVADLVEVVGRRGSSFLKELLG